MLTMVLADGDGNYIYGIGRFISVMCRSMFDVSVYTTVESFRERIGNRREKIDVLIAGEEFAGGGDMESAAGSVIVLSEDCRPENRTAAGGKIRRVRKFQQADCLVGEILDILSEEIDAIPIRSAPKHAAPVIGMCSPCGGSGTTLASVNLAQCLAELGMRVMYVNFENLPSSRFFFRDSANTRSFSNVIYSLKLSQKNMNLKIENSGSYDDDLSISYFKPQSCSLEIDEMEEGDCLKLFNCLKENGKHDVIVVDIGSGLSRRGTTVMRLSDIIGVVMLNDAMAAHKNRTFADQIRMVFDDGDAIFGKLVLFNNCRNERHLPLNPSPQEAEPPFRGCADEFDIAYAPDLFVRSGGGFAYNINNAMKTGMAVAARSFAESIHGFAKADIAN
jgi:cellulose biosynthesis protein BcsQ